MIQTQTPPVVLPEMTLTKAMREHLLLPGEDTAKFVTMYKGLDDADKEWYRNRFQVEGYCRIVTKKAE